MRIIITENKFKSLIHKVIGYDLSERIEMITSWEELTGSEQDNVFGGDKKFVNIYLNKYGPMYRFNNVGSYGYDDYLVQNQKGSDWFVVDASTGYDMDYYDFLKLLGIDMLGVNLRKIIDEFVIEE